MANLLTPQERSQTTRLSSLQAVPVPANSRAWQEVSSSQSDPGRYCLPVSFENTDNVVSFGVDPTTLNAEAQLENSTSFAAPLGSVETLRPPPLSFWFVYVATVTYTGNFTVVIPTSVHYMEKFGSSKEMAGFVVGVYCICGGLMNIPQSRILKRMPLNKFLVVVLFLYVVGNCCCAGAEWCGSIYVFILGRLVTGAIGGPQIAGTYVARAYDLQQRSSKMVLNASANGVGYAFGPLISALGGFICDQWDMNGKLFNKDTAGSWIMAIVSFGLMFCVSALFTEPPPFAAEPSSEERRSCGCAWFAFPVAVSFASILCVAIMISSWETHCQLVAQHVWGWSIMSAALYLATVNIVLVPTTLLGSRVAKKVSDRAALLGCAILQLPSMVLLFNFVRRDNFVGVGLYSLGSASVLCFVQVQRGFLQAIITKQVGGASRQIALGYFSLIWLCGRGVGAFMGDGIANDDIYTTVLLGLGCFQLVIIFFSYKKLALDVNIAK